jgi:hypothetical protein
MTEKAKGKELLFVRDPLNFRYEFNHILHKMIEMADGNNYHLFMTL